MSCFNGLKLTKLGEILLANINGNLNETLIFTSGAVGAGAINDENEINSLTALKDKWKDLDILNIEKDEDDETIVKLELQFSNVDLQEAKLFREIGIYAKGNNGEPVLFAYSNAGENYDYVPLPKDNPQTFTIQINLKITSNSKIDAIINMAGFVTIGKMVEFLKSKLTQIPTVIELQSRKNLKVGDIVEVLGYYTAGDGAGHKRIIANEDDGSGVQLNNKLWANIVHNGEVNVSWFGAKGDGVTDDLIYINKALSLCNNLEKLKIKFNKCKYYVTSVLTPITFNKISLEIDGNECEIIDGRTDVRFQDGLFQFKQSKNISIYNFKFTGHNHKDLSKTLQPCISFMSSENINIKKIKGENLYCTLIRFDPRKEEGGCYNFKIKDITAKYITGFTIMFSSFDHGLTPAEIANGVVDNVYSFGNGKLYENDLDFSKGEWSAGIDFGEALNSLKNVKFINCHSENCAESGFHAESSVVIDNVSFENCSSINNGQKPNATYGFGWFCPEGVVIKNCISSKNKGGPINFSKGVPTSEVEIYDSEIGRIYYRSDYPMVAELYDKEKMLFGNLEQSYGMTYVEAAFKKYNRNVLNIKKDSLGRYINKAGLATNLIRMESKEEYYEISGLVSYDNSESGSGTFFISFGKGQDELIPNTPGGSFNFVSFNSTNQKIDNFDKIFPFKSIRKIKIPDNVVADCFLLKFAVMNNIKLRNLSIKKCLIELDKNIVNDLKWFNTFLGPYQSEYLGTYSKSYFIKEEINNKAWLFRNKNYDGTSDKNVLSSPFYCSSPFKIELKYTICKEGDIAGVTTRIALVGDKQIFSKNLNPTDTETSFTEIINIPQDVKVLGIFIGETGNYADENARILYSIDSVKIISNDSNTISKLDTLYMSEKMKQEGVYNDYITYMDEKTAYSKQQEKFEREKQLAYEQVLQENPNLTYEEFLTIQPTNLNLIEEPQPSKALQDFMDKYL